MPGVRQRILQVMADAVAGALINFDERTGRFLSKPEGAPAPGAKPEDLGWAVTNQDILYPLAVLYTTPGTRFHGDRAILNLILRAGDAIREFQYPDGQVEFLKADGSRWGRTFMCWTNYAWLEAYALLHEELDEARRQRWKEGLTLAHDGQAREVRNLHVHNVPCWTAMSCYRAGQLLARPDWQEAGTAMIRAVVAAQQPGGYWAEHGGPSTLYNYVYVHGLGLYYKFTADASLLRLQFEREKVIIEGAAERGPALQQFVVQAEPGDTVRSGAGHEAKLGDTAVHWRTLQLGAWLEVNGCRIAVSHGAEFRWPTAAFNPYAADGAPPFGSERGVLAARIDGQPIRWEVEMQDRPLNPPASEADGVMNKPKK